jgi:hypothetical protein
MNKAVIALAATLTGFANGSPVMPTGNNSYMISVVSHSQFSEASIRANRDALSARFCILANISGPAVSLPA